MQAPSVLESPSTEIHNKNIICCLQAGLVISNIDIDIDSIDDTFDVSISISTILSYKSIDRGIDDTFLAFFIDIT